jgi:hypothetical protein
MLVFISEELIEGCFRYPVDRHVFAQSIELKGGAKRPVNVASTASLMYSGPYSPLTISAVFKA